MRGPIASNKQMLEDYKVIAGALGVEVLHRSVVKVYDQKMHRGGDDAAVIAIAIMATNGDYWYYGPDLQTRKMRFHRVGVGG